MYLRGAAAEPPAGTAAEPVGRGAGDAAAVAAAARHIALRDAGLGPRLTVSRATQTELLQPRPTGKATQSEFLLPPAAGSPPARAVPLLPAGSEDSSSESGPEAAEELAEEEPLTSDEDMVTSSPLPAPKRAAEAGEGPAPKKAKLHADRRSWRTSRS